VKGTRLAARVGDRGIYWLLAAAVAAALALVPEFRSPGNLANVLTQAAPLGLLAVGQTFVVLCGLIDLSVGQLAGLVVVLVCDLARGRDALAVPVAAGALALGVLVGALNGLLATRLRIHTLILTLGMMSVLQGAIFTYTDQSVGRVPPSIAWLADGRLGGVPVVAVLVLGLAGLAHVLLTRSVFGLHVQAVGGNRDGARRAGVATDRVVLATFALSGLSASAGGLLVAGRLGTGYPHAGAGLELDAIVAVVLGGTALAGGRGTIAGTVAAVLLLGVASNVLNLLQISSFVQMFLKGLIVVAAILVGRSRAAA